MSGKKIKPQSKEFKELLDTYKNNTVVLGPVRRHLMAQQQFDTRDPYVIHPSELANRDFCSRAIYYRISGYKIPSETRSIKQEVTFFQGHEYHTKWQTWIWDTGFLRGEFLCRRCGVIRHTTSPTQCEDCGAPKGALDYREVPVDNAKYLLKGRADGDLAVDSSPLLEIKSVGEGTFRFDAPELVKKYTQTITLPDDSQKQWTDWEKLWNSLKRPLLPHRIQGAIYGWCLEREEMVFIYEFKSMGMVKEFSVRHDFDQIEERLEACLDIKYHLSKGRPPECSHGGCDACRAYEEKNFGQESDSEAEQESGESAPDSDTGTAGGRDSRSRGGSERARRRGTSRRTPSPHSLGGLLGDTDSDSSSGRSRSRASSRGRKNKSNRRVVRGERDGETS